MPMIPAQMDADRALVPRKRSPDRKKRDREARVARRGTKKAQILSLFTNGVIEIQDLAEMTDSKASYVASVLQENGLLSGYFDLYTHSAHAMNVYSKFFSGRLGFRDEETARNSVDILDEYYRQFRRDQDRAGQHHALTVALTMLDRARWCGKKKEAKIFHRWLVERLNEDMASTSQAPSARNQSAH